MAFDVKGTVNNLGYYINYRLDLAPALQNSAKDLAPKARLLITEIISKWPAINNLSVKRLVEAILDITA